MRARRTTYDMVEAKALKLLAKGHDVKLYFNYHGHITIDLDGKTVLVDKGRDYKVAFAKLEQISDGVPALPPNENVTDKDVRRGRKTRTKAAVKKRAKKKSS